MQELYDSPPNTRFGYFEGQRATDFPPPQPGFPSNTPTVTATQPGGAPQTAGQKRIAAARANVSLTLSMVDQADPPERAPVRWPQTRSTAGAALDVSRTRTSMLSEGRGLIRG